MTTVGYLAWGCFGGFAVEALEFAGAIRRVGTWPWRHPGEPGLVEYSVCVLIRLVVGAGLAAAAGTTGQVRGPFGALAVGVAAPLLVETLARQVPLTMPPSLVTTTPPAAPDTAGPGRTAGTASAPAANVHTGGRDAS